MLQWTTVGGGEIELGVRVNRRARRISLKIDPTAGNAILVLPARGAWSEGIAFAEQRMAWLRTELGRIPPRIPFADGAVVPYLGGYYRIHLCALGARGIRRENGEIIAVCDVKHLSRRVTDWFRAEARLIISDRVSELAARLGRRPRKISFRDPKTRWGSCAPSSALSFSWRLVMAPRSVLDYVVAHEMAHLAELNHGPRFWAVVSDLHADYDADRRWLRTNGAGLHRYG